MKSIHPAITLERIENAIIFGQHVGFCNACGEEQDGCEPDARNYTCECCEKDEVYGAEEFLFLYNL